MCAGTSHVIAVSGLQWQHQARCVDVPGYLKPNPPACLLTAASLAALSYQAHIHCDICNSHGIHFISCFWAVRSVNQAEHKMRQQFTILETDTDLGMYLLIILYSVL